MQHVFSSQKHWIKIYGLTVPQIYIGKNVAVKAQNMITKIWNLMNFSMSTINIVHKQTANNQEEDNILDLDTFGDYVSHSYDPNIANYEEEDQ